MGSCAPSRPRFAGARPHRQTDECGVKQIGATAHSVTADLDEGPIIEQGTVPVHHAHTPSDFARLGRDVERLTLARAVQAFPEGRVFLSRRRTVIFR
jgi:formyltetrahydrofolate deformylase